MNAILAELVRRQIDVHVTTVGCAGQCVKEPLVDVQQAGGPSITYGNGPIWIAPD
jgi:NADP-reducing hydrogenase subunit HndB